MTPHKKMLTIVLMALLFLYSLSACAQDTANTSPEDAITLRILSVGSSNEAACQRISRALSQITLEQLGFSVELSQVPLANYDSFLSAQFLNGNEPDLFCFTSTQTFLRYAQEGHLSVLDSYITVSSPLRHNKNSEIWQYVKINEKTYAVPSNNSLNYCLGFCARKDIVEEMGVDPNQITDWDSLYHVLLQVKQEYPEMMPVVPHNRVILPSIGQDPLGDDLGVLMHNQGSCVENLYASEDYKEACHRMYQWQQEGLILPQAFSCEYASGHTMRLYNGFGFFANINSERLAARICAYGEALVLFPMSESIANSSSINSGWCISSDSPYKEEAVSLLELLYTNQSVSDLCIYGEENVDYKRLSANTVTRPDTPPDSIWEYVSWAWPNRQIASRWVLDDSSEIAVPDYGAVRSPAMGFVFDSKNVLTQCNHCLSIVAKYDNALLCGYLNPDDALPQFLKELEDAGINQIIAEKQKQLDAWLSNKT